MPSVRYYNQTAPFWDFVSSLESQGFGNRESQFGNNEDNEWARAFGPQGWGGFPFGGPFAHRGRNGPPGPPPAPEQDNTTAPAENEKEGEAGPSEPRGPPPPFSEQGPPQGGPGAHRGRCGGRGRGGWGGRGRGGPRHGGGFPHGMGPFGGFGGLAQLFQDQLFDGGESKDKTEDFKPEADVFDTPEAFVIHVSLPGAKKEDVGVNWDAEKSELSIAGVIYRPGDEEFLKTLAMDERKVGAFERKVRLGSRANPAQVDVDGISARMEDGVLRVEVPKLDSGYVEIKKVDIDNSKAAIPGPVSISAFSSPPTEAIGIAHHVLGTHLPETKPKGTITFDTGKRHRRATVDLVDGMHSDGSSHSYGYSDKDIEALDAAAKALAGEECNHEGTDGRAASNDDRPRDDDTERDGAASPPTEHPSPASNSTSDTDLIYPEGGLHAWLTVLGAWCGMTAGIGLLNTVASLQSYLSTHQLQDYRLSSIGWIFSVQALLVFFCGIQIGPLFDAIGPRALVAVGSVLLVVSMMVLGECTAYWHFVLDFSILNGLGGSLLLTPPLASIGHYFNRRRAFATGIAMSGPSMGGVIFPLVFRAVYPQAGFAWACRALGLIIAFLLVFANLFIRSRLPRRKVTIRDVLPDFRILLDGDGCLALCTLGLFLMELGLFIPLAYLTSYCIANGMDEAFSYNILAILNAASVFGRALPGLVADKLGRYNTDAVLLLLTAVTALGIWLPLTLARPTGAGFTSGAIVFAIMFGFASGSNLSLTGPCIGQLCETKHYGRYFSTCYVFISFAALIGIPIAGNILDANGGDYWGLIVFTGVAYVGSAVCMAAVRVIRVGWSWRMVF